MTTAKSPEWKLREQADRISVRLRSMIPPSQEGSIKFAVVMDDKSIIIDIAWSEVARVSRQELSDLVLAQMKREPGQ